jgi:endonuclease/exonuclease/phosphatase family metal-dependent hydrolase
VDVGAPIRILTANLCSNGADPAALTAILEDLRVDVACFQELGPGLAQTIAKVLPEGRLAPDDIHRGLGIASRRAAEVERLPLPARDGWVARLSPAHWPELSEPIEIVDVHIVGPHTWPYFPRRHTRGGQLAGLLRFLDERPHVPRAILGDFNASPLWPVYRRLSARLTDSVVARHRRAHRSPTWPHVPAIGLTGLIRIDHCFLSKLVAVDTRVVPIPGSDHLGLCVDVVA